MFLIPLFISKAAIVKVGHRSIYSDNDIEVDEIDGVTFTSFVSADQLDNFVAKKVSSRLNRLTTDPSRCTEKEKVPPLEEKEQLLSMEKEELLSSICPPTARIQVGDPGYL